jgi:ABC-2 type transport system permease protein
MSAVSAELMKIRTTKVWWGMLIGLVVWAALWSLPTAFLTGLEIEPGVVLNSMSDDAWARSVYTTGLTSLGFAFTLVLGILVLSGEYRHQTITPTILSVPRRPRLVLAKWVAAAAYSLLYGVVALAVGVAVSVLVLSARGLKLNLGAEGLVRALLFALLAFVLWGLIGIGIGTLVGNQIVAILVGVGVLFIDFLAQNILPVFSWGDDVTRWLPIGVTSALIAPSTELPDGTSLEVLPWWGAGLVLVAYALVTAGLGAALTLRRDVT